jgi:hypothetical protein
MEKIMCLIPPPKHHLIRFHGVLAPNSSWRSLIVPRKKVRKKGLNVYWIPWAELLRRTFEVDSLSCVKCKHKMRVVSVVLDPKVIQKIMKSLGIKDEVLEIKEISRGPPQDESRDFDESYDPEYENEYNGRYNTQGSRVFIG